MACDELGVRKETEVVAKLYKMLLYEPGAMFKPHTNSEKLPGMFGTMVVSLPSPHSGGAVEVSHNGKSRTLRTENHEYLAWIVPALRKQAGEAEKTKSDNTTFQITFLSKLWEQSGIPAIHVCTAFKAILEFVIPDFSLRKPQTAEEDKQQDNSNWGYPSRSKPKVEQRMQALDGKVIASVLEGCRKQGLHAYANSLLTCLSVEVCTMDPQDFPNTILRCLKRLMLWQRTFTRYITRYVCKEPTSIDWTRETVDCTCKDCVELNSFLQSSDKQVERFAMAEKRRKHLQRSLDSFEYFFDTDSQGSPHKLIITKKGQTYQEKLGLWNSRAEEALHHITDFDRYPEPRLFKALPADKYNEVMTLSAVKKSSPKNQLSDRKRLVKLQDTVITLRQKLEAGFFGSDDPPKGRDVPSIAQPFTALEDLQPLEQSIVKATEVNQVV